MGRWCSRNIKHQVRMLKHVRTNSMAQSNQEQLRAFTPRKFHTDRLVVESRSGAHSASTPAGT
jgi:hypothetical protein